MKSKKGKSPGIMVKMKENKGLLQSSDAAALKNFRGSGASLKGSMKARKRKGSVDNTLRLWGQGMRPGVF